MKEPGPTGTYAVNVFVWQIEELHRCVFNVFLDNQVPIDYPEGSIGILPFTYPASWASLKLSPEDQQAVETAYLAKYREPRATLSHVGGNEPLTAPAFFATTTCQGKYPIDIVCWQRSFIVPTA